MRKKTVMLVLCMMLLAALVVIFSNETVKATDGGEDWWDSNWRYRKKITIDHNMVTADLENFPVLIHNISTDFKEHAQDDGDDFIFISEDNSTKYNHEIEYYDNTIGELIAWVNITELSKTADTILYMYYGNQVCSNQENAVGVWDSNYLAVWHMDGSNPFFIFDSTSNGYNGISDTGSPGYQSPGKIGYGVDFEENDNDRINMDKVVITGQSSQITVEYWAKQENSGGVIIESHTNWEVFNDQFCLSDNGHKYHNWWSTGSLTPAGEFAYNCWTYDGTGIGGTTAYHNGLSTTIINAGFDGGWTNGGNNVLYISTGDAPLNYFDGIIDEIRISNIARSPTWISTSYKNHEGLELFILFGNEKQYGSFPVADFTYSPINPENDDVIQFTDLSTDTNGSIVGWWWDFGDGYYSDLQNPIHCYYVDGSYIVNLTVTDDDGFTDSTQKTIIVGPVNNPPYIPSNPNPVGGAINQPLALTWSISITDADGDLFDWTIECNNSQSNSQNNDINGTKQLPLSGLTYNTYYTVWVNATDGYDSANATFGFTTRTQYLPNPPGSFTATTFNKTQINLAWIKGNHADKTYIEWNTMDSWTKGEGYLLYNESGTAFSHTNLDYNTQYFYQAWSWNNTDNVWSATSASGNTTTGTNNPPTITNVSPINNSIVAYNPTLKVTVDDADGDELDVFWYSNVSGLWNILAVNLNIDTGSGPVNLEQTNENFNEYSTSYWWRIICDDGSDLTNETYKFTLGANNPPTITNPYPSNGQTEVEPKPVCNFTVSDDNLDLMTVKIYENTTTSYSSYNSKISSDVDDAYYYGEMKNGASEVVINNLGTNQLRAGLRFRNVQIPQGATITNANLRVRVWTESKDSPDFTFYGHDIDDSPVIEGSTGQDLLINRQLTSANVQWIDDNIGADWIDSPDISRIIQEIVNRPGWKIGNNITILTNDVQSAKQFSITDYQLGSDYGTELNVSFYESIWTLQQINTSVTSNSTIVWNNFSNASMFSKKYWWSVNVTDGNSWKNEIFYFITKLNPNPSYFVYVDDDYYEGGYNDGHTWGYDAFDRIQDGIDAVSGSTVYVYNGIYYENIEINKDGINLIGEDKNTTIIDANDEGEGIYVSIPSHYITISNFTVRNANGSGIIFMDWVSSTSVIHNTISDCIVYNSSTNHDNPGYDWADGYGILLAGHDAQLEYNTIINCEVYNNDMGGIFIIRSAYDQMKDNRIIDCKSYNNGFQGWSGSYSKTGIGIGNHNNRHIQDTIISGCEIYNNAGDGIYSGDYSSGTKIINNTIYNNGAYGINVSGNTHSDVIYHNNLINNGQNAYDTGSNIWDDGYPSGGNYWDDYIGTDTNNDNIGDIPYLIPGGGNQDNYPLGYFHPIADFTYSPVSPTTLDIIQFTDTSNDPDGSIVSWYWDFDDGNTSTTQSPTHQYTIAETYAVNLTVTDNDGKTNTTIKMITVNDIPAIEQLDQGQTSYYFDYDFHSSRWCAQSFKPTLGTLTRVELYIGKKGIPPNDIEVSIHDSLTGAELTTVSKSPDDISSSMNWVEFDFNDIGITPDSSYYIVVNTTGGNTFNGYRWGFYYYTPYTRGSFYRTINAGGTWSEYYFYDFCFKTYGV